MNGSFSGSGQVMRGGSQARGLHWSLLSWCAEAEWATLSSCKVDSGICFPCRFCRSSMCPRSPLSICLRTSREKEPVRCICMFFFLACLNAVYVWAGVCECTCMYMCIHVKTRGGHQVIFLIFLRQSPSINLELTGSAKLPIQCVLWICLQLSMLGLVIALDHHTQLLYVGSGGWTLIFSLQGKHFHGWAISPTLHFNYKKLAHMVRKADKLWVLPE